jgi:hypothetical protein
MGLTLAQQSDLIDFARAVLLEYEKSNRVGKPTVMFCAALEQLRLTVYAIDHPTPEPAPAL